MCLKGEIKAYYIKKVLSEINLYITDNAHQRECILSVIFAVTAHYLVLFLPCFSNSAYAYSIAINDDACMKSIAGTCRQINRSPI